MLSQIVRRLYPTVMHVYCYNQDHRQGRAGPRPDFPQRQARPTGPGLGFVPSKARKPGTGLGFVFSKARKPGTGPGFGKNYHKALYFRASPENPGPGFPSGVIFTVHCGKLVVDAALPINTRALIYCWALRIVAVACNRNRKQEKQRLGNITPIWLSSLCDVHIGAGSWSELRQETTTTAGAVVEVAAARSNEHRGTP